MIWVLLRHLRLTRIVHYAGMALGGLALGWTRVAQRPFDWARPGDYLLVLDTALVAFFAFQSAVYLNDYFDLETDRHAGKRTPVSTGALHRRDSLVLFLVMLGLSLAAAAPLGLVSLWLVLAYHFLSFVYSAPPLRIKRFYPLSIFTIALWGWTMMLCGFAVFARGSTLALFPPRMTALVLVTLTMSFGTKDAGDYEGDRRHRVHTLFTLLGPRVGGIANGVLVLVAYLVAPLVVNFPWLYAVALPCGIASFLVCLRPKIDENLVFLLYYVFGLSVFALIITGRLF